MRSPSPHILAFVFTTAGSVACAGSKDTDTGASEPPSFAVVRDDVLLLSCGFSSCHGGGAGGLTLDEAGAYDALVDVESTAAAGEIHVIPGDPDNSYLIKKLEAAPDIVDDPMPPPLGGQDPADIELIRAWIAAGAAP